MKADNEKDTNVTKIEEAAKAKRAAIKPTQANQGYEELVGLHQYLNQYLDAVDEERTDNQKILLKTLRKLARDLDELFKK